MGLPWTGSVVSRRTQAGLSHYSVLCAAARFAYFPEGCTWRKGANKHGRVTSELRHYLLDTRVYVKAVLHREARAGYGSLCRAIVQDQRSEPSPSKCKMPSNRGLYDNEVIKRLWNAELTRRAQPWLSPAAAQSTESSNYKKISSSFSS